MNDKIYKSFYLFLLNLGIVSLVLFALHKLSLLRVDLIFNESWLFAILIFSFTFCIAVKDKLNRSGYLTNRNIETIFEVSPYFFLSILVILAVNQFLKLDFLTSRNFHIVVLGIAFGFLAFYRNRDRIENELEDEKKKEEEKERDRANDFEYKFPKINRIWGIRSIVKWMYKEGWSFSIPFLIITVVFIGIKIGMPLVYNGSYLDEYLHIWSGIDFFSSGHFSEVHSGVYYKRGIVITLLSGIINFIFGKNILFNKFIPASFGIVSFFILYFIAKRFIYNKKLILLLLLVYTFNYLVILNHFYLRMYFFYETILLLSIYVLIKISDSLNSYKPISRYLIILLFLNILNVFMNDLGAGTILLANLISLIIIYKNNSSKLKIMKRKPRKSFLIFIYLLSIISVIILPGLINYFLKLLSQTFLINENRSADFYNYFFKDSLILTIMFLYSFTISKIQRSNKFIIPVAITLFCFHLFFLDSLKLLRVMLYFVPLYLMISINSLIFFRKNKILIYVLSVLILVSIFQSYPANFILGPAIKNEVRYMDNSVYSDAKKMCLNKLIIVSSRPGIAKFYGVDPDYYLNTKYDDPEWVLKNPESNYSYYDLNSSKFFDFLTKKPVLINLRQVKEIYALNKSVCYISGGLPDSWVSDEVKRFIENSSNIILEDYRYSEERFKMQLYIKEN